MKRLFFLFLFLAPLVFPSVISAREHVCDKLLGVRIVSEDVYSHEIYCDAALKTFEFLSHYQLYPQRPVTIEVLDRPVHVHGMPVYGLYDGQTDRIQIMSYRAISTDLEHPEMFGERFDIVHYLGAIAHEIAHAVIHHQTIAYPISASSQEYFAYAVQLAVLPADRREIVLERIRVKAWMPGDTISEEYMAIDPGYFAVKSYKHLTTLTDPTTFIDTLLNNRKMYVYVPVEGSELPY